MAITNFHDISLSNYIALGAKIKAHYKTTVLRMRESHEERIGEWQDALREYDIGPVLRDQQDLNDLIAFFRSRNGPKYAFKIPNPIDFEATAELFGTSNGSQTQFQLCKRYLSGIAGDSYPAIRPIVLPDAGLQIFHNSILVSSGVSTDLQTGVVTFVTAPTGGFPLTWTGTFQDPVRFMNKEILSIVEVYQNYEANINLMEQRAPVASYILQEEQSPDFVETNFPTNWVERSSMGPKYDVIIVPADGGESGQVAQFTEAKIKFQVDFQDRSLEELYTIYAFFLSRRGKLVGFRVRDITDYTATNQLIGIGDGIEDTFQLLKIYQSGSQSQIRIITKPVSATFYLDGAPASPQPDLDLETGELIFDDPPEEGVLITWTGLFDVPVRFDTDTFEADITGYEVHGWQGLTLTEIMIDLPEVVVANVAQSIQTAVSGCAIRPFPEVQPVTKYILFPGDSESTVTTSPLQLRTSAGYHFNSAGRVMNGATSLTVAFAVSHLEFDGTVFKLPQANSTPDGVDPEPFPDIGAIVQLYTDGSLYCGIGTGGVKVETLLAIGDGSGHCHQIGVDSGTFEFNPSEDIDPEDMHIYIVTFDWFNGVVYTSGIVSGFGEFVRDSSNFISQTCLNINKIGVLPTVSSAITQRYTIDRIDTERDEGEGNTNAQTRSDMAIGGDAGQLGGISGAEAYGGWGGRLYEIIIAPSAVPLAPAAVLRLFHTPVLAYLGSLYGVGYPRRRSLNIPPGALRLRADTDVTLFNDIQTDAVLYWGNQGIVAVSGRSGGATNWHHPTQVALSGSLPTLNNELKLAKIPKVLLSV